MTCRASRPGSPLGGPISHRTHTATSQTPPQPVNPNRLNGPGFSVTVMPVTPLVREKLDYTFTPFMPSSLKRRPQEWPWSLPPVLELYHLMRETSLFSHTQHID